MTYVLHIPGEQPHALRWTNRNPLSSYGSGALVYEKGTDILDGALFRYLRDHRGAWLETDSPDQARLALRLRFNEFLAPLGDAPSISLRS